MKKNNKIILITLPIVLITIDQIIKMWICSFLYNDSIPFINGILNISYVQNKGGAYGIGSNNIYMFILINVIVIGILIKILITKSEEISTTIKYSLILVLSGGIGNLIDRIFRGFVVDYIDFTPIIKFPIFNFADICIVIGIIIIAITIVKNGKNKQEMEKQ